MLDWVRLVFAVFMDTLDFLHLCLFRPVVLGCFSLLGRQLIVLSEFAILILMHL